MKAFADLLERLVFTPSRNGKLSILERYLREVPDPDRGLGLAALTDALSFRHAKPALIRELVGQRVDPTLFALSYDFVGDLAETTALIWPGKTEGQSPPRLGEVVEQLSAAGKLEMPQRIAGWLDQLDPSGRIALLKLITGGLRVGISARLAKTALARFGGVPLAEIEELWHGLAPPYGELFAWLEGRSPRPAVDEAATFKPLMLANPLDDGDVGRLSAADYLAEWKWDGIRVQVVAGRDSRRLYSRTGDDIGAAFPDILEQLEFSAVLDGELLVLREDTVAPFNDLQQRLGRKSVSRKMLGDYPAHIRLYDILFEDGTDLRELSFIQRRQRLEDWCAMRVPGRMDLSPLVPFDHWDELAALRAGARQAGIEGLMLKHRDSPNQGGRPKGP